ncbi:MAG: alpha/beta hydrolase [Cytophagaceae bacterium]|jgi:pimeloyl-ACP methyl ester carboxylesterase|nr:alpha/beta hydrolase [Cytophagaceae bacterium]
MKGIVYLVSGLGADSSVFEGFTLQGYVCKCLEWSAPLHHQETLESYCQRVLLPQLDCSKASILLGVSFGAVIAQQLSQHVPQAKLVLVSTIRGKQDWDWKLQLAGLLRLYALPLAFWLKHLPPSVLVYFFGVQQKQHKILLRSIIRDTDIFFANWAIRAFFKWKGITTQAQVLRIHGNRDKIIPLPKASPLLIIEGGHFLIAEQQAQVLRAVEQFMNIEKR